MEIPAVFLIGACAGFAVWHLALKTSEECPRERGLPGCAAVVVAAACGALAVWGRARFPDASELSILAAAFFALEFHALTDWLCGYIFDRAVWLSLLAGAALRFWRGEAPLALAGSAAGAAPVAVALVLTRGAFGWGDATLMAGVGSLLGWKMALLTLYFAVLAGGGAALPLLLIGRVSRRDALPFAPFLLAGMILACLFGRSVLGRLGLDGSLF